MSEEPRDGDNLMLSYGGEEEEELGHLSRFRTHSLSEESRGENKENLRVLVLIFLVPTGDQGVTISSVQVYLEQYCFLLLDKREDQDQSISVAEIKVG